MPVNGQALPAGQSAQPVSAVAPVEALYVPTGQGVGLALPAKQ